MNDNNSLAHTTWNCKYQIVFAPKYRRKILLQENREEMGKILRELCDWKGIKIAERRQKSDQMTLREMKDPFTGSK